MTPEQRYLDALEAMDGTQQVGMKASVEAIADGEMQLGAEMLHAVADGLEGGSE